MPNALCKLREASVSSFRDKFRDEKDHGKAAQKLLRIMKLTCILLLAAALQVSANGYSQKVTLNMRNVSLEKVFKEIKAQTGYLFLYNNEEINKIEKVSVNVKDVEVETALGEALTSTAFTFKIVDQTIVLTPKPIPAPDGTTNNTPFFVDIHGRVINEKGDPVAGVTITVKGTKK